MLTIALKFLGREPSTIFAIWIFPSGVENASRRAVKQIIWFTHCIAKTFQL
jgi:hypothetical protein